MWLAKEQLKGHVSAHQPLHSACWLQLCDFSVLLQQPREVLHHPKQDLLLQRGALCWRTEAPREDLLFGAQTVAPRFATGRLFGDVRDISCCQRKKKCPQKVEQQQLDFFALYQLGRIKNTREKKFSQQEGHHRWLRC